MSGGSGILGTIAKIAVPVVVSMIPGIGPLASAAIVAAGEAGITKATGGSWGQAAEAGALSGLGSAATPILGNAFSSIAPETAASLGVTGNADTVFGQGVGSGVGGGLGIGSAAANSGGGAGSLNNSIYDPNADMQTGSSVGAQAMNGVGSDPNADMQTASPVGAQAMNSSGAPGTSSGGPLSSIPGVGNVLSKAGSWAADNPIPTVLGAGMLYSGVSTAEARAKAQKQLQNQQANNASNNAAQQAAWQQTLQTPGLNRTQSNPNVNYATYGQGPEQQFFNNNQTSLSNNIVPAAKDGGHVRGYDDGGSVSPSQTPAQTDESNDLVTRILDSPTSPQPQQQAKGGVMHSLREKTRHYPRKNGKISGPGGPTGDKIPAMLSDGEFVIKAKSVSRIGNGNNNKGAKILDKINNGPAHKLQALGKRVQTLHRKENA